MKPNPTDTGWQAVTPTGGDGERCAVGEIELATTTEDHPCYMCRSFERDLSRTIQHAAAHGCPLDESGRIITPIAKDIPGREAKALRLNPSHFGWCRRDCILTEDEGTCENWTETKTRSELQGRIG